MKFMNWFKKRSLTAKYMILAVIGLCFAFSILAFIVIQFYEFESFSRFVAGIASASVITIIKLVLIDKSVNKSSRMQEKKAENHAKIHFFIRYFLTIAYVVVVLIFNKYIGVFGAVIGLFNMQLSSYIANYFINVRPKKKSTINKTDENLRSPVDIPLDFDDELDSEL